MAIQIIAHGTPKGSQGRIIGRVTHVPIEALSHRQNYLRVVAKEQRLEETYDGYAAVLFEDKPVDAINVPYVQEYGDLDLLRNDYVVVVDVGSGFTHVLYRPESTHNGLFATDRCNSNCLMCSQPPRNISDDGMVDELLRIIELIPDQPEHLTISGGEPTLLKDGLIQVLEKLKAHLPDTAITILSNGRMLAYEDYVEKIGQVGHGKLVTSVPLYANNAKDHDYIVQRMGAFDQTMRGLYNAAKRNLPIELRVVLHKQTISGLPDMVDFIYRNLPFVTGVMLMGMENMGYVKKNWHLLWEDPVDYAPVLETAVKQFYYRRISVCIYNLPLCVLPESLWFFAQQSISDFKNIYLDECRECGVRMHCAGFFSSSENRHSRGIRAIRGIR